MRNDSQMTENEQITAIITSWPVLPEHIGEDGTRCFWSGVNSQTGKCPDGCSF